MTLETDYVKILRMSKHYIQHSGDLANCQFSKSYIPFFKFVVSWLEFAPHTV